MCKGRKSASHVIMGEGQYYLDPPQSRTQLSAGRGGPGGGRSEGKRTHCGQVGSGGAQTAERDFHYG